MTKIRIESRTFAQLARRSNQSANLVPGKFVAHIATVIPRQWDDEKEQRPMSADLWKVVSRYERWVALNPPCRWQSPP